jgi:hypothetical protein
MSSIDFVLDKAAHVLLNIQHVAGIGIATLLSDILQPGKHSIPLPDHVRIYSGKVLDYELVIDGQPKVSRMFVVA